MLPANRSAGVEPESFHDEIDEDACFGRQLRAACVVDRDRSAIGIPLRDEAQERATFQMRERVGDSDQGHAEPEQRCPAHRLGVVEHERLLEGSRHFPPRDIAHQPFADATGVR